MLEYKHQFECLLALCWINPVLDLEAFPQASHGEGTFPMLGPCSWVWSSGAAEQSIEIMEMDAANPLSVSRADIDPLTQE